ncbi:Fibronectin type III domain-containing protein 5 [Cyphomyrmex costatus]|uniref:Fibronectin type III domain-containing protein 5 n=1 Tax=Cyphomyrmex costatus TaxID=456900 RepID=A0A195CE93_9HYME|nr:Fibronectin type III domain-containing protein 5 [Cyphomyrmex costatus]
MVLWATILILQGAGFVGSVTGIPGVPENITVMFLNPTSVRVSWSTSQVEQVEKYDVTYKPTDARVVAVVAGNSEAVTLSGLRADTQYQLVVTAVRAGKKFRSRPIVFRTLEPPRTSPQQDAAVTGGPLPPPPPSSQQPQPYIQIRGVEVGIVVLVLIVWAGAIALFFNRWGKIRMLLPYQPDYKEQLKVPGTGVCAAANAAYTQHPTQHACSQHLHWSSHHVDSLDSGGALGWPRTSRPRVNSAIDVAGFLSQEFLRRHGSTSKLCRKVRSADNLPLASTNRQQDPRRNSKDESTEGDRESFLKPNQDDKSEDQDSRRQSSLESATKDNTETSLLDPGHQQPSSRCYRRSYESDITRLPRHHHYHRRADVERHTKSCDYARRATEATTESSIEVQHFGLPILSVSEPSPPDESERVDDYL